MLHPACALCTCLSIIMLLQGDVGRIMVVLLTDGRANVSLAKSNADPDATKLSQVRKCPMHHMCMRQHSGAY